MATWAIGDIQGCFEPFQRLLRAIEFEPARDQLWLAGDLVNRGPASLDTLRWAHRNRDTIRVVLGNHDLHLLAVAAGLRKHKKGDTLQPILDAEDADVLIDWLRAQPLMWRERGFTMVHAGIPPAWSLDEAEAHARQVEAELRGDHWQTFLQRVFAREDDPTVRAASAFTTLRMVDAHGRADRAFKDAPSNAPESLRPWFQGRTDPDTIVFGHWAALGLRRGPGFVALDSGCVWGGQLSAFRLESGQVVQVEAQP